MTPATASSRRSAGFVNASRGRFCHKLRETEEVAFDRRRVGVRPPEIDQVGDRLQGLAALAQQLADAGVLEIAGLDQAAPDDHRPLIFLDLAIRLADREKLVEREDQLGGLLLDDLEVRDDLARLLFLDVDQEQHAGRILGDVVAERVAAEERLRASPASAEPAGVEVGLAASVELVGRRLVRVGAGLAGLRGRAARRASQMESPGFVALLNRRGQGPILTGQISVDVVGDRVRVLVRREVERQRRRRPGRTRWRRADRALDQGRAGGKMLLDDQEIALPFRSALREVSADGEHDVGLAARARPGWRRSQTSGLTATPNPIGSTLPSSSGAAG